MEKTVLDILDSVGNEPEKNLRPNAEKIHSLADYARKTQIFKESVPRGDAFFKGLTPVEIYTHMLCKIVDSPTRLHADAAVILTIPHLSDSLKNIEEGNKYGLTIGCRKEGTEYLCIDCDCESPEECDFFMRENGLIQMTQD